MIRVSLTLRAGNIQTRRKKMFVISSVYKKPVEVIDAFVKADREFLDRYYEKGIFITS